MDAYVLEVGIFGKYSSAPNKNGLLEGVLYCRDEDACVRKGKWKWDKQANDKIIDYGKVRCDGICWMEGNFKWYKELQKIHLCKGTLFWEDNGMKVIGEFEYVKELDRVEV